MRDTKMSLPEKVNLVFSFLITVATLFNVLLWWNSRQELSEFRKSSQANLLVTLNRDFFFNDRLYRLRKAIDSKEPILKDRKARFTDQDVDDYVGFFELLEGLVDRDMLEFIFVAENFCGFVTDAHENKEIIGYIADLRNRFREREIYSGFEKLAERCSTF